MTNLADDVLRSESAQTEGRRERRRALIPPDRKCPKCGRVVPGARRWVVMAETGSGNEGRRDPDHGDCAGLVSVCLRCWRGRHRHGD